MKKIGWIVLLLVIIYGAWYLWQKSSKSTSQTSYKQPTAYSSSKPIITNTSGAVLKGNALPNYVVLAYSAPQTCLKRSLTATYGKGKADQNGSFSINLPLSTTNGKISVLVAALPENSKYIQPGSGGLDECFPAGVISEAVSFNYVRQ